MAESEEKPTANDRRVVESLIRPGAWEDRRELERLWAEVQAHMGDTTWAPRKGAP